MVCMNLFFSLRKWYFQPHDVDILRASGGFALRPSPGFALDPAGGLPSLDPLPVSLPNQNSGSAGLSCGRYTATAADLTEIAKYIPHLYSTPPSGGPSRNFAKIISIGTRGQSNLTKSASRGAHSPVRGHPRRSKVVPLNSWGRVCRNAGVAILRHSFMASCQRYDLGYVIWRRYMEAWQVVTVIAGSKWQILLMAETTTKCL